MNTGCSKIRRPGAFTLLEMTIVIMVLLALISTGLFVNNKMDEWKLGKQAGETLRTVYAAQRMYLADNPTAAVSSITNAKIIPYLPNQATTMPKVTSLVGTQLNILVNVSPPVINGGSGVTYDPSGSSNDSLWDVGE
ncbi:MAG: type II secretion system protein [Akkermansiaceae bacterium]|nr:type II secretion system protein [Akkermansiaceae bacterium]MCP5543180.1 type II secretion system protein [Akkermansiaceae bacterium]MCP5546338.1 type II secretion system protein [Akkermansiaceae bacterium]